ncbi:MAG: HlyD family efflux transporter periplasmic adaptor subunit [Alphaproteobacteria bacterium]|nr:HlyD family efflux transporter periplasmic adaptor subunit [Alphaproteobacteria bacterium]
MGQPEKIVALSGQAPNLSGSGMDRRIEKKRLTRRRLYGIAGGAAALALIVYLAFAVQGGRVYRMDAAQVTVSTVQRGTFDDFIPVRGKLAPLSTVYLETIEGGRVDRRLVEDGALVKAGQPLIDLSNAAIQLDVISREAQIAEQMNNLRTTDLLFEQTRIGYEKDLVEIGYEIVRLKRDLDRKRALVARGAISRATFDQVSDEYEYQLGRRRVTLDAQKKEQDLRAAQAAQLQETVKRLESNLDIARRSLDALQVKAPIDGQLTALDAEVGQSKQPGARLGQIDSVDAFKVTAEVDEFYVARVDIGQSASFTLGGQKVMAKVAKIYPQIREGRFTVDLTIDGPLPAGLRRGQAIDLRLELGGSSPALLVANGPFYQDTGGNWAFVLDGDGTSATRRDIRLGRRNPQVVEVLGGLNEGDRVVTSAYQSYLEMDRIAFDAAPN